MVLKNIWSLNVDEAIVADKLRTTLGKSNYEVFFPINSQLKDIDLVLINLKKMKSKTIQVKGSRTYEPTKSERDRYGRGNSSWIQISKKSIIDPTNKIDFFIIVLHNLVETKTKKQIKINYLIIPYKQFVNLIAKKKTRTRGSAKVYDFFIWIDDKGKRAFDFKDRKNPIQFSKYLDSWKKLTN